MAKEKVVKKKTIKSKSGAIAEVPLFPQCPNCEGTSYVLTQLDKPPHYVVTCELCGTLIGTLPIK